MKNITLLFIFQFMCLWGYAQDARLEKELGGIFNDYSLLTTQEHISFEETGEKDYLIFRIHKPGEVSVSAELVENHQYGTNAKCHYYDESGQPVSREISAIANVRTYESPLYPGLRLNHSSEGFIMRWTQGGKVFFLEPATRFSDSAKADQYIWYDKDDVISTQEHTCGNLSPHLKPASSSLPPAQSMMQCKEIEIGMAIDYSAYLNEGSTTASINYYVSLLNIVEGFYVQFSYDFILMDSHVANCSSCDPWTSSVDGNALLNDFMMNGASYNLDHDVNSLWTDRNFYSTDMDGNPSYSTVGLAWEDTACGVLRYNVNEHYSSSTNSLSVVWAHEIGHTLGSGHDNSSSSFIMAPSVNSSASSFSSQSESAINSYVDGSSGSCITTCAATNPNCTPSNDECTGAIQLNVSNSCQPQTYTIACATESMPSFTCDGYSSVLVQDVFFEVTPTFTGTLTVEVFPTSGMDPVIAIMNSCSYNSLMDCVDNGGGHGDPELISFSVTQGQTYYIRIYDWTPSGTAPTSYDFDICVHGDGVTNPPPPPPPSGCTASFITDVEFLGYETDGDIEVEAFANVVNDADDYIFNWYINGSFYDDDTSNDEDDKKVLPCGTPLGVSVTILCNNGEESTESAIYPFSIDCEPIDPCQANAPQVNTSVGDDTCNQSQGYIQLNINGGLPPYSVLWNNGSTQMALGNLSSGNYAYTLTDANGCQDTGSEYVGNNSNSFNVSTNVVNDICNSSMGEIEVAISGGQTPYSFMWNDGLTQEDRFNLGAGTYTLTITDASGCSEVISVNVTNEDTQLEINGIITNAICGQSNGMIEIISVVPSQGMLGYNWSNGGTGQQISNLQAGTYTVTVTNPSTGCASSISFTVTDDSIAPMIDIQTIDATCGQSNGGFNTAILNDNGLGYDYFLDGTPIQTGSQIGLSSGNYTLSVLDANGCQSSFSFEIGDTVNPPIALASPIHIYCSSGSGNTGSVSAVVSGGVPPYTFDWSNGQTGITIDNVASGDYEVTITDAVGCTTSASTTVMDLSLTLDWEQVNPSSPCAANGKAAVSIYGGVPPYDITWTDGLGAGEMIRCDLSPMMVNAIVVDANGCMVQIHFNLEAYEPTFDVVVHHPSCYGDTNGEITVGQDPDFQHQIFQTMAIIGTDTITTYGNWIPDLPVGVYEVIVLDEVGCEYTVSKSVMIEEPQILIASAQSDMSSCGGNVLVAGGTPPYQYYWLESGDTTMNSPNYQVGEWATVQVMDANGCTALDSIQVLNGLPNPNFTINDDGLIVQFIPEEIDGEHEWHLESGWTFYGTYPTEAFKNPGEYTMIHTITNECGSSSDTMTFTVTDVISSVLDHELRESLILLPNPNNGLFSLSFGMDGDYEIIITNILGQIIGNETIDNVSNDYQQDYNISHFPNGTYMVSVRNLSNNAFHTFKVVKAE